MKEQNDDPLGENKKKKRPPETDLKSQIGQEKFGKTLSDDELLNRKLESFEIFQNTAQFVISEKERNKRRSEQTVELQNGETLTIESFLTADVQPYLALFPNDSGFFKELFRVAAITDKNPDEWDKPPIIGVLINEMIYRRFGKDAPRALRARAFVNGHRRHKFSQYLDPDGKELVVQYREEVINMAKEFKDGDLYEFRLAYAKKFNVEGHQYRIDFKYS